MNIAEVKLQLINVISQTQDKNVLAEIGKLLKIDTEEKVYQLSEEQEQTIQIAEEQIEKGEYLSHEEAKTQTLQLLQ